MIPRNAPRGGKKGFLMQQFINGVRTRKERHEQSLSACKIRQGCHLVASRRNNDVHAIKYRQNGARCSAMTMRVRGAASAAQKQRYRLSFCGTWRRQSHMYIDKQSFKTTPAANLKSYSIQASYTHHSEIQAQKNPSHRLTHLHQKLCQCWRHMHTDIVQGELPANLLCSFACCCQASTMSAHMQLCIHGALFYLMWQNKAVIFLFEGCGECGSQQSTLSSCRVES